MYTYVSVYIINNKLLLLEVVELFIEDKLSDKYRHFFPLLVPCLFSENTPFLHGFFLNNEGYSAWDCKLFAWIAHGLIMLELHVRCECVGHICVDLLSGWWAGRGSQGSAGGVAVTKTQTPLGTTPPYLLTQLVISVHSVSCTVSLES